MDKRKTEYKKIIFHKIIRRNLCSKYREEIINYNIAQINSILFNYSIKNSYQYIKYHYKEMIIISDDEEYFNFYTKKDSILKLHFLGYIYTNNFKPPPNYLSLDKNIYNIMCKLLNEKQKLIDRIIDNKILVEERKKNKNKNRRESIFNENNNNTVRNSINISKISYKSFSNKNQSFDHKYNYEINKSQNKIIFLSKNNKNINKNDSNNSQDINENSINSIVNWMEKLKKRNNINNGIKNLAKIKINIKKYNNNINKRKNIKVFSNQIIFDKNKINKLFQNLKDEKTKENYISVDNFKEKSKKNKTIIVKQHIDNIWKSNKNFFTNLIKEQNLIKNRKKFLNNRYFYSINSSSENSTTNINNHSNNYNSISNLSQKSEKIKKLSFSSKSLKYNNRYIKLYKYKIPKIINNHSQQSLINKIQNDSDFMKNKNYSCVFPDKTKSPIYNQYKSSNSSSRYIFSEIKNKAHKKMDTSRKMKPYNYKKYFYK